MGVSGPASRGPLWTVRSGLGPPSASAWRLLHREPGLWVGGASTERSGCSVRESSGLCVTLLRAASSALSSATKRSLGTRREEAEGNSLAPARSAAEQTPSPRAWSKPASQSDGGTSVPEPWVGPARPAVSGWLQPATSPPTPRLPPPLCSSALTPCPRASLSTSSFKSLLTCCRLVAGLTPPPKRNSCEGRGRLTPRCLLWALHRRRGTGRQRGTRRGRLPAAAPGRPAGQHPSLSCHGYHRAGPGLALLLQATRAWGKAEGGHGARGRWEAKTHPLPEADERHPTSAGRGGREAGAASAPTRQCQGTQQHEPGQSCGCGTGRGESPSSAGGGSALAAASQALAAEQPRGLRVGDPSRDLNAQKPT